MTLLLQIYFQHLNNNKLSKYLQKAKSILWEILTTIILFYFIVQYKAKEMFGVKYFWQCFKKINKLVCVPHYEK